MDKFFKFFEKMFEQDGARYSVNSMSIAPEWLENDPKAKEVSQKIQELWKKKVDDNGFTRSEGAEHEGMPRV